ncbi:hypothetical protein CEUSTIGMA_g8034.t1 [Chlamydomonas eustigma]|uniref:Carbohydrate kinase PfkB domain-containing protein n=1 Tax=Chlamydomonas eustigma TaxID=1157962 RepID=A0A250XCI4_9CHLO|nr:hypothetical protein CEUSTIGMA_g8034.t1 [Chlamydomonas eustigma]|eukprot:GAX80599.1 hypothetical protein CEUSTIGMA_g8034.t1 [Chlamydomonas eustigma]
MRMLRTKTKYPSRTFYVQKNRYACYSLRSADSGFVDVVALGNICLDVIVPVDTFPQESEKEDLLRSLTLSPPSQDAWEVGGNCNFMIAAARLGLSVGSIGVVGDDVYGEFLNSVLQAEHIALNQGVAPDMDGRANKTLICFVLVDPNSNHAFCSRYDFGPWPLLEGITSIPEHSLERLRRAKAVFTNGFVFDEIPLDIVQTACKEAIQSGAAVFFDPGPRCFTMLEGSRKEALSTLLDLSDVILMTEEEAKIVTGHSDPELAAKYMLERPGARTQWCVIKLGREGSLLRSKAEGRSYRMPGIPVKVQDTVGCGDSFASAIVLGFINGHSIPATLALANAVGAATATGRGAGRNVANSSKVKELLSSFTGQGPHNDALAHLVASIHKPQIQRSVN